MVAAWFLALSKELAPDVANSPCEGGALKQGQRMGDIERPWKVVSRRGVGIYIVPLQEIVRLYSLVLN